MQETIEKIKYLTKSVPEKEFHEIIEHIEEAKPYLYDAINEAIDDPNKIIDDRDYMLLMYALYLLAEAGDKGACPFICRLVSLPSEELDGMLGSVITENLNDIIYSTFDGNVEALKELARDDTVNEYARSAILDVLGQLYGDGVFEEKEWKQFLRNQIYEKTPEALFDDKNFSSFYYTGILGKICQQHFIDMLPDVRYLCFHDIVDTYIYGEYDECVDIMFDYSREEAFCNKIDSAADELRNWAMYEDCGVDELDEDQRWEQFEKSFLREMNKSKREKKIKIGRNDPCPCGSGRKYKQCCMNKPKSDLDQIESEEERRKWLKYYPEITAQKQENRIYLDEYYDAESIEIDRCLYLALKHRAIPMWERDRTSDRGQVKRKIAYLWKAFGLFSEKMEKEGIQTAEEFDKKYSIHYTCYYFLNILYQLLKEQSDQERYKQVGAVMKKYQV